jgi:hypothetical protein
MLFASRVSLTSEAVRGLQDLVDLNSALHREYEEAARGIDDLVAANLIQQLAQDCADQAAELQACLAASSDFATGPWESGLPSLPRAMSMAETLEALLMLAEQAEGMLKDAYQEAMSMVFEKSKVFEAPLADILSRHFVAVTDAEQRIAELMTHRLADECV